MDFDIRFPLDEVKAKRQIGSYTIIRAFRQAKCIKCNTSTYWRNNTDKKPVCCEGCLHYHNKKLNPITVNELIIKLQELVAQDPSYGRKLSYLSPEGEDGDNPQTFIEKWPPKC